MATRIFKIHPAIGIARLGDADRNTDEGFFIGPETPGVPANWDISGKKFLPFKLGGRVKAQAARFRVWEYVEQNGKMVPTREVTLDDAEVETIEWAVHLANRKASFFEFQGQKGAADNFASATLDDLRNKKVPDAERAQRLEIDEGSKSIQGRNAPKIEFINSKQPAIPIRTLGELRTDGEGRLLVLGGEGQSNSSTSLPPPPNTSHPVPISNYANNDTWFDDVSDGPVTATVRLRLGDGTSEQVQAEGAWVLVGPPDFAPAIGNVVTLYDTLWDIAVREPTIPIPENNALYDEYAPGRGLKRLREMRDGWHVLPPQTPLGEFRPSFTAEIFPMFNRAFLTQWVHLPFKGSSVPPQYHERISDARAEALVKLPGSLTLRKILFSKMRNPDSNNVGTSLMPKAFGDDYNPSKPTATSYLSLTRTQYALLRQWMDGEFIVPAR